MPARSKKKVPASRKEKLLLMVKKPFRSIKNKATDFMSRRPHRSFRLTRRRDYDRALALPGYAAFTREVNQTLKQHKRVFLWLTLFYTIALAVTVGISAQDSLTNLTKSLRDTGTEVFKGDIGQIGNAGLLITAITTTGIGNDGLTQIQQVYTVLLGLLVWLTTVWLLRSLLAGHKVRMRDGLYTAGAPIVGTLILAVVLVAQMLPMAIAFLAYNAASSTGLLDGGVEAMLFWVAAALLTLLSLYWITSTFFALIIVTLPGMYPLNALKIAGDLMIGRRIRILLRLAWMGLCVFVGWALIMIPVIIIDAWIKGVWSQLEGVPLIPIALLIMGPLTIIWIASYVYLLYRKVVDDDSAPA